MPKYDIMLYWSFVYKGKNIEFGGETKNYDLGIIKNKVLQLVQGNPVSVGLDIGNHSVKIVEILHHPSGPVLMGAGIHVFKVGTIVNGEIRNKDELLHAIQSLLQKASSSKKQKEVNFALSWSYGVLADRMKIKSNNMESDEEQILSEASRHSPFDVEDIQLDYKIINKNETNQEIEVLLVAAKYKMMQPFLDLIRGAGLTPINVDVDTFAIANGYFFSAPDEDKGKVVCLANIGEFTTNLTFIKHGHYHSTRDIPTAGHNFIRSLENHLEVSNSEATSILKGRANEDYDVDTYLNCIEGCVDELSEGMTQVFNYFQSSEQNLPIDKIILSGGGACIERLPELLSNKHDIEVKIADPLSHLAYDKKKFTSSIPKEISTTLTVATGLALRKF